MRTVIKLLTMLSGSASGGSTPPDAAPISLTATPASATQTNLAWINKASNADGVRVYRSTDAVSWTLVTSLASNVTSYSDTGITGGVNTYHQVRAYKGSSELSSNIVGSNTLTRSVTLVAHLSEVSAGSGLIPRYDTLGVSSPLTDHANTPSVAVGTLTGASFHSASSQYFSTPDNANVKTGDIDFYVSAVIKLTSKTAAQVLISKWDSGTKFEYRLRYASSSDRFIFDVSNDGTTVQSITANTFGSPSTGAVIRVIGWHDSVNNQLGIAVAVVGNAPSIDTASYSLGVLATTALFLIGASNSGAPQFFVDGGERSVAMAKCVPSTAEITGLCLDVDYPYATQYAPSYDPTTFVTRTGNKLFIGTQPFVPVGLNAYWMGLFTGSFQTGLSAWQVEDGMQMAVNMGASVLRIWCGGFATSWTLYPTLGGAFNESNFVQMDRALVLAKQYGLRVILTLFDGVSGNGFGDPTAFSNWGGTNFYTDATSITNFKVYVAGILNRVNSISGTAYKNDSTIAIVETGNEVVTAGTWTSQIAAYIKSIAPNMLVMDGKNGVLDAASLTDANVDAVSNHFYPMSVSTLNTRLAQANLVNKVFGIWEYDWNGNKGSDDPQDQWFADLEGRSLLAGDAAWMLPPHDASNGWLKQFGGDPTASQGYAMMLGDTTAAPAGQSGTMQSLLAATRLHIYRRRNVTAPAWATPGTPLVSTVNASTHTVTYRGVAGASSYNVQTSADNITYANLVTGQTDIAGGTVTNAALTAGVWVRIVGVNPDGVSGTPSAGVQMV